MGLGQGAGGDHLTAGLEMRDAAWAFDAYEAVRRRLPRTAYPAVSQNVRDLSELADRFDVFLLDAFGVLNVGQQAIPGAPARVAALQAAGKIVIVLSNAASYPKRILLQRYARLGFHFDPADVLTSREVCLAEFAADPSDRIGLMAPETYGCEELEHLSVHFLNDDPATFAAADCFLLLGSGSWSEHRQSLLETALRARPRPVIVGNPDIVAPRETGLSMEPGHFAHRLIDATGCRPQFFGKPFPEIFEHALKRLPADIDHARIVMVGDTLQTDILGGQAAGFSTALVTGFGSLTGLKTDRAIEDSGIVPWFIMPRIKRGTL